MVLNKNLPKDLQRDGFTSDILRDEEKMYCVLDVVAADQIYQAVKLLPELDILSLSPGDSVVLYSKDLSRQVAIGSFNSTFTSNQGGLEKLMCKIQINDRSQILVPNAIICSNSTNVTISSITLPNYITVEARFVQPHKVAIPPPRKHLIELCNPFDPVKYQQMINPPTISAEELIDINLPEHVTNPESYVNSLLSVIWCSGLTEDPLSTGDKLMENVDFTEGLFSDSIDTPQEWKDFASDNATLSHCLNLAKDQAALGYSRRLPRVQGDIFHAIQGITKSISKTHPLLPCFSFDLSNALLCLSKDDFENVSNVLKSKGEDFFKKYKSNPRFMHTIVKRFTPPIALQFARVCLVLRTYCHLKCPKSGRPLFCDQTFADAGSLLRRIRLGFLQDLPGVQLYVKLGKGRDGFTRYRCLRSTSQQEGGFHSDAIARFVMGHNMGPKLTQAVLWNYIGRFNTKVLQ